MKYVIILPDGASDEPLPQLDGKTPLEAAAIPNIDRVAKDGRQGRSVTVPDGFIPATDVATLSLFGYDPHRFYSGRAPIEAVAMGLDVRPDQVVFRCNFVTLEDGRMKDFTAGHITQEDSEPLIADLNRELGAEGCDFHAGVSYRNLMLLGKAEGIELTCQPPHDIADQLVEPHWPRGKDAERAMELMRRAEAMLKDHPVNQRRAARGDNLATNIWLWGQGRPVTLEPFADRFNLKGAVITGVDIIRGIAVGMGMELIHVPGATGYIDTDYAAKGAAALRALDDYDVVVVHVEAPDEAGHLGDAAEKVKALERIDQAIVGPMLEELERRGDWRLLVAPDHPTPVSTKAHSSVPPPFAYAGSDVEGGCGLGFTEKNAEECGVFLQDATDLIWEFLDRSKP